MAKPYFPATTTAAPAIMAKPNTASSAVAAGLVMGVVVRVITAKAAVAASVFRAMS